MDAPPASLDEWRNRLFHVTEIITLSEEEWNTYWPYVDNIWSHRSTQKSKKGPFQTHYYDCRLKGRPPGTPQNQDPNKKKRKRTARERDLCDMKIKVIETFGGSTGRTFTIERVRKEGLAGRGRVGDSGGDDVLDGMGLGGIGGIVLDGSGGGGESAAGPDVMAALDQYGVPGLLGEIHRHTLEESDRIKKCTVEREGLKRQKEMKKVQVSFCFPSRLSLFSVAVGGNDHGACCAAFWRSW